MFLLPLQITIDPRSIQILVAEDDDALRNCLARALQVDGYGVVLARNGRDALEAFDTHDIDFVLLALRDGLAVCRELRKRSAVPLILLTANTHTDDVVAGIESGADHYMTKPFVFHELRARMHATLRRVSLQSARSTDALISFGAITLNKALQQVTVRGEMISLTPHEYRLLSYLMHNPDQPVSHAELLRAVWNYPPHEDSNITRVTMWRLRSKVEAEPATPQYLKTVHHLGYQFSTAASDKVPAHTLQWPIRKAG